MSCKGIVTVHCNSLFRGSMTKEIMNVLQDPVLLPIFCITLFMIFKLLRDRGKAPFPPGPPQLPVIGNMLMMGQLTHRGLAALAERYGGLLYLRLGFRRTFVVSTPEMARQVLQVQDIVFSNRPAAIAITYLTYNRADMAFAHYGPYWRQMRKLSVTKLFSRKRAESWTSVRDEVDMMIRTTASNTPGKAINLGELIFSLTTNITFKAAFGAQRNEDQVEFISILEEFSKLFGAFNVGDFIPWLAYIDPQPQGINKRLKAARGSLDRFIDKIIDAHMKNPKGSHRMDTDMVDDMLEVLVDSKDGKGGEDEDDLQNRLKITRDNIKAIIMDVMFGGTETVGCTIEWAMAELMKNPDDMQQLQAELANIVGLDRKVHESDLDKLPFLKCVVKETLRLHPPVPLLLHETAEDCIVDGYFIPKQSRIMINVFAIGHDKTAWKDADTFRPLRFSATGDSAGKDLKGNFFEFLPFGSGRRSCPGMQLGLYALELAVAQLVHCFNWKLPDAMKPKDLDMSDVFGLAASRTVRLSVVPTPRLTCPLF